LTVEEVLGFHGLMLPCSADPIGGRQGTTQPVMPWLP
jgi:hypothetical protein